MSSIAALTMAWQRRMSGIAGPLGASGEASNGNPVMAEMKINGVWIDITSYVMVRDESGNISITKGQPDESTLPDKSTCSFLLNNRDGRFSPRNPSGVYFGLIGRNTEFRISVPENTSKNYRFWGEISEWPQKWDTTGTDIWVEVQASGLFRRLSQGRAPTHSVVYDAITSGAMGDFQDYWPCEDPVDSTLVASALVNHSPMTIAGSPVFAAFDQFPTSDPLPTMTGAQFTGGVKKYSDPTATQVRFFLAVPADGAPEHKIICRIAQDDSAFTTAYWELAYVATTGTPGTLSLAALDGDGSLLGITLDHTLDVRGKLVRVSIELSESGANLTRALRVLVVGDAGAVSVTDTQGSTALTRVLSIDMCPNSIAAVGDSAGRGLTNGSIGHVTLQTSITAMTDLGLRFDPIGETAGRRIQRVCSEQGIPFEGIGDLDQSEALGNQTKLKPLDTINECAATDLGIVYESLSALGVGYRTRGSLYNQDAALTLTYASGQLAEIPLPTDDDLLSRNSIAVTNSNTSISSTAEQTTGALSTLDPPMGIGIYGEDSTINVAADTQLPNQAYWRLNLGTVDEARYPQISVNLAHPQFATNPALKNAVLSLRVGDRIDLIGPLPEQAPDDISVLVVGFSETITHFEHRLTFNCSPASPWDVGTLDSLERGRLDTAGSYLTTSVSSSATSFSVTTSSGPVWTPDHTETPFDLRTGGEVVTVVANGTVVNANPLLLTGDITGWMLNNSTVTYSTEAVYGDGGATASVKVVPNGSSASGGINASTHSAVGTVTAGLSYTINAWVLSPLGWADLRTAVDWYDASDVFISSSLGSATSVAAGVWTFLTQTFTAPALSSRAVARGRFGSTPATTDTSYWWNLRFIDDATTATTSPQTMTVVRSINTVSKAQTANTDIRLASPIVLSL